MYNLNKNKMNDNIQVPTLFWVISGLALLWNLMGVFAFYTDVTMTSEAIAAMPDAMQSLYNSAPAWTKAVYGFATLGGALGCIGLLLRKSWSVPVLLISLLAIIIQMAHSLFMTNAIELMGTQAIVMPIVILIIGALLYYYSRKSLDNGWLS